MGKERREEERWEEEGDEQWKVQGEGKEGKKEQRGECPT